MMENKHPTDDLKPYSEGELSWFRAWRVRRHLASCEVCRGSLEALTTTTGWVRSLKDQAIPLPEGLSERIESKVMSCIAAEGIASPTTTFPLPRVRWLAWGATGAFAAAVLTVMMSVPLRRAAEQDVDSRAARPAGGGGAVGPMGLRRIQPSTASRVLTPGGAPVSGPRGSSPHQPNRAELHESVSRVDTIGTQAQYHRLQSMHKSRLASTLGQSRTGPPASVESESFETSSPVLSDSPIKRRLYAQNPQPLTGMKSPAAASLTLLSRMRVVRKAEVTVRVRDLQERYGQLVKMVKAYRGFVSDLDISTEDEGYRKGTAVVRVPPEYFEDLVQRVQQFGKVVSAKVTGEEVTEESMRLEEQLPRLRQREADLAAALERLQGSRDNSARFYAQERLAEVRSMIEEENFRLRFLKDQVRLATVTVAMTEKPQERSAFARPGDWSALGTLQSAYDRLLVALEVLATLLIWAVVYFSLYVVLGLACWQGFRKARQMLKVSSSST